MIKKSLVRSMALCGAGAWLGLGVAAAQGVGNWSMTGGDAGQSGWQKAESTLAKDNIAKDFKFLWKIRLGQPERNPQSFSEPLLAGRLINAQGFKDIAFWSNSDTLYAVDYELGNLLWQKHFDVKSPAASATCRDSSLSVAIEPPPVINFNARRVPGRTPPPQPPPLAPNERRLGEAAGGGGFGFKGIYVLTRDGYLHEQILTTGADFAAPVKFLPAANSSAYGLNILGKMIYTTTGRGCGSVPNAAWAIDVNNPEYPVSSYMTQKVRSLNLTGPIVSPDGTSYIVTGRGTSDPAAGVYADSVVALTKDLKVKDWYTPKGAAGNVQYATPVTFTYKGKQLVAAPGKDGTIVLLDGASLGGADHHTPLSETVSFSKPGERHVWESFSHRQDKDGTAWVFASISGAVTTKENTAKTNGPTPHGAVVAFKVEDADEKLVLTPVWISGDMTNPAPTVSGNGVLVALSGGDAAKHATLYVLDAATGQQLYSSKDEIPTYTHFAGLSLGDGHVFFTDHDSTLYSFGIAMEH